MSGNKIRIHVLSDIHLEFEDFVPPQTESDLVILAGDTGWGLEGIKWAKKNFPSKPVLYIPGNHEYYHGSIPDLTDELRAEAKGSNIFVLNNDMFEFNGVTILGSTLWTDCALYGSPELGAIAIQMALNDFRMVTFSPEKRRLLPTDIISFHGKAIRWLEHELEKRSSPLVVATHYAPSEASLAPFHFGDRVNAAYASNLEPLILKFEPDFWIHGHSHYCVDYNIGKTRIICNPKGYPQSGDKNFDPGFVFEI